MLKIVRLARSSQQLVKSTLCCPQLAPLSTDEAAKVVLTAAAEKVIELSTDSDIKKALAADKLSVLDFTAKWCGPCKMIAPEYSKMSAEFPKAAFYKIDIDNPDVQQSVSSHEIAAVPTFKFMRGSETLAQVQGADKTSIRKLLQQHAQ